MSNYKKHQSKDRLSEIPNIVDLRKRHENGKENLKIIPANESVLFFAIADVRKIFLSSWNGVFNLKSWKKAIQSENFSKDLENYTEKEYKNAGNDEERKLMIHEVYFKMGTPLLNKPNMVKKVINETYQLISTIVDDWDTFTRGEMEKLLANLNFHFLKILAIVESAKDYFTSKNLLSDYEEGKRIARGELEWLTNLIVFYKTETK